MRNLAPLYFVPLAIAEGATTPVPSQGEGAVAYSTTLHKIVYWNGTVWRSVSNRSKVVAVTYAASVSIDCSLGDIFDITLAGPLAIDFTNGYDGQKIELRLTQDASGNRLWTPGLSAQFSTDLPLFTLSAGANKTDIIGFEYSSAISRYRCISYNRGF